MPQTINTNLASLNAQRNLNTSQSSLATSLQRLSSGLRINSAKDDAAGLAISERMNSQIRGLDQAARNSNDAISLAQTAEGNLSEISNILQRMREISVQSANDTNTPADRQSLQNEVTSLSSEIDRIADSAQFNGKVLLDGTFGSATFQVGANAGQTISMTISGATNAHLGLTGQLATATGTAGGTVAIANTGLMTINGTTIGASTDDTTSYVAGAQAGTTSAKAAAAAINLLTSTTSVTATASNTITSDVVTSTTTSGMSAGDLYINGVDVGAVANVAGTVAELTTNLVDKINGLVGAGVTALVLTGGTTYSLSNTDGSNIDITSNLTTGAATYGDTGFTVSGATAGVGGAGDEVVTNYGSLSLTSTMDFTIGGTAIQGLTTGPTAATGGTDLSVNSQPAANTAIGLIDAAIDTINSQRANLGTSQTRFDSVISNLRTSSENLSAARGRIRDTDFAAETANMTRSQVLQQAGVAMLAQANALPNIVLSLLK
jgi:flagellin